MFFSCGEVDRVSVAVADEQAVELLCTAAIFIVNDAISPLFCDLKQVNLKAFYKSAQFAKVFRDV